MICLLCQESNKDSIKLASQEGKVHHVSPLLFKYFRFCFDTEPIEGDLCTNCWYSLVAFHEFYVRIETVFKQINEDITSYTLDEMIIKEEIVEEDEMDYDETEFDNSQLSFKPETGVSEIFTSDLSQVFVNEHEDDDQTEDLVAHSKPINLNSCKDAVNDTLPEKSLERYMQVYARFVNWQKTKGTDSFSEPVLLDYFGELSNTTKSSTMLVFYSMLKRTILSNQNINISEYSRLMEFLNENKIGFKPKKSKLFTNKEMTRFLTEAPDDHYLAMKTWVVLVIIGVCRGYETTSFKTSYVQNNLNEIVIRTPDETNKNSKISKTYVVDGRFAEIVRKYMKQRPPNLTTDRFFLQYLNGKCTRQIIGRHSISKFNKEIAKYLQLPDWRDYNTHSYSRLDKVKCLDGMGPSDTLPIRTINEIIDQSFIELSDSDPGDTSDSCNDIIDDTLQDESQKRCILEKSQKRYMRVYNNFVKWQKSKATDSFAEPVLLDYFMELSNTSKFSTLLTFYSMLRSTILSNQNINISKYSRLMKFLNEVKIGFQPKRGKLFTGDEVTRFLMEAPDDRYLAMKTVVVFVAVGMWKGEDLIKIKITDIQDNINGIIIRIPKTKNKISKTSKVYVDGQLAEIVRKYIKLRPENSPTDRLFMRYADGKCTIQVIGKHKIGSFPKEIAKYLKLPDWRDYTERSFRELKLAEIKSLQKIHNVIEPTVMHFFPKVDSPSTSNAIPSSQHYENDLRSDLSVAVKEESFDGSFTTIEESSTAIKEETNDDYLTTIPENICESFDNESHYTFNSRGDIVDDSSNQNINISEQSRCASLKNKLRTKTFTTDEFEKFMLEAPDYDYLAMKAILAIRVTGLWSHEEMMNIKISDIQDNENEIIITAPKTHGVKNYIINGRFAEIVRKYSKLRPENSPDRFFIQYRYGGCTLQTTGRSALGNVPKEIAKFLQLPDWQEYTAHSLPDKNCLANSFTCNQRLGQKRKIENVIEPAINLPSPNSSKKRANATITTKVFSEIESKINITIPSQQNLSNSEMSPVVNKQRLGENFVATNESFTTIKQETITEYFTIIDESLETTTVFIGDNNG